MPRSNAHSKSRVCTYCGRVHPKGKKQREKAKEKGWTSCSELHIRRTRSADSTADTSRFTHAETQARRSKNASIHNRQEERKAERIKKARQISKAWRKLSAKEQLAELDKRPGFCLKQRVKIFGRMMRELDKKNRKQKGK